MEQKMNINCESSLKEVLEFMGVDLNIKVYNCLNISFKFPPGKVFIYYIMRDGKLTNVQREVSLGFTNKANICNKNGPGRVQFTKNNTIVSYYKNNNLHRFNGPARIIYDCDGNKIEEKYCVRGRKHNSIGPAFRTYIRKKWNNYFYLFGMEHSKEEFFNKVKIGSDYESIYNNTNFW